jgi:hypothetical protein
MPIKKPLKGKKSNKSLLPLGVGDSVLIRTVTHYFLGKIVKVTKDEYLLVDAAWVADTGRFTNALNQGPSVLAEVEPYPRACEPVCINKGSVIDRCRWPHGLPKEQK